VTFSVFPWKKTFISVKVFDIPETFVKQDYLQFFISYLILTDYFCNVD